MTDNHGYETPRKGATEWHESLNRNFRYIDRDVEIRDIDAAKTDYRPKSGAKFFATDTEDVYVGDGSQWLRLATSGENPMFDTVSAKAVVDRDSGNSYSVDQLAGGSGSGGVKPSVDAMVTLEGGTPTAVTADGTQLAQDANAAVVIQEAANHISTNGGSIVLGTGTFPVNAAATTLPGKPSGAPSNQITMYSNMTLRGQGMGATILEATGQTQIGNTSSTTNHLHYRDFTFDGQNQGGQTCLWSNDPNFCTAVRVGVVNCGSRSTDETRGGIMWRTGSVGYNKILNCYAENTSYVNFATAKNSEYNEISGCIIKDANTKGNWGPHPISVESNNNSIVTNNIVVGEGDPAININAVDSVTCANNTVRNTVKGINIANGGSSETVVANNTIVNSNKGMRISVTSTGTGSLTDNLITNNTVRDYGEFGIELANGAHSIIKHNVVTDKAGNGNMAIQVQPSYYPPDIIGNLIVYGNGTGIEVANTTTNKRRHWNVSFNKIVSNSSNVVRPVNLAPNDCTFIGNNIMADKAGAKLRGDRSIILGNRASTHIGDAGANSIKAFNLTGVRDDGDDIPISRSVDIANTSESKGQTVALSTGSTPAARVNGVSSVEGSQPILDYIKPVTGTTPAANYAFDHYFEYDNAAGEWDLVITWQSDPGSDIDVDVQIGRRG